MWPGLQCRRFRALHAAHVRHAANRRCDRRDHASHCKGSVIRLAFEQTRRSIGPCTWCPWEAEAPCLLSASHMPAGLGRLTPRAAAAGGLYGHWRRSATVLSVPALERLGCRNAQFASVEPPAVEGIPLVLARRASTRRCGPWPHRRGGACFDTQRHEAGAVRADERAVTRRRSRTESRRGRS